MKKEKILFILPAVKSLFGDSYAAPGHPHVGIAYLSAFLKSRGVEVSIFDAGIEKDIRALSPFIKDFEPSLIGVTVFSYCHHLAREIIKEVRKTSALPIVAGGPHISATKTQMLLEDADVDFAIKGEGEETLLELFQALNNGKDYSKIDGLIWRSNGQVVENHDRDFIEDLDSLPLPDYESFGLEKYLNTREEKKLPIITSRGCPYGCNFCSVHLSMGRGFRPRSPENILKELEYWYGKGFRTFDFNDDCFSLDLERAMKVCDLIIGSGMKITYQLYNGIRADRLTKEFLKKMKDSGCNFVSYGCESGNEEILKAIEKGLKLEQVRNAVEWSNEAGIRNSVNFIIGHPHETYRTAMETLDFAKSLPCDFVNIYNLVPYPGTELYKWIKENGRFLVDEKVYLRGIASYDNEPIFETKEFSKKERVKVNKKGRALYERRILEFRLGKRLGYIAYLLMRLRPLAKLGRTIALSNKLGNRIYVFLSRSSRKETSGDEGNKSVRLKNDWEHRWSVGTFEAISSEVKANPDTAQGRVSIELLKKYGKGARILEAGCGLGVWVFLFEGMGFKTFGVDFSETGLRAASAYGKQYGISAKLTRADIRRMPFPDNTFDVIVSYGVVEHFDDSINAVKEMLRVLKPGGTCLVTTPNPFNFHRLIGRFVLNATKSARLGYVGKEDDYTPKGLAAMFKEAGFRSINCGILDEGLLFGMFWQFIPFIGGPIYNILKKFSLVIERSQRLVGTGSYATGSK
ncbi:MAG: radical SAM protein [Candidatus Omnitrophica bacterium]|nr:radical SAM protein [Candidatus Omnitrophota bacterium]MDD5552660.1 radical SAM protein [Candidatus Omnitrophota bacterium]